MILNCERCGQQHEIDIDQSTLTPRQRQGIDPVIESFICPDVACMHRVTSYALDTRSTILNQPGIEQQRDQLIQSLISKWGEQNFNQKLARFKDINISLLGLPDEYYELLVPIIDAYSCGYYYPSMTAAGSLGERILNRLIIKTRKHYRSSKHYKKIYGKHSFDDWVKVTNILKEWGVISEEVSDLFLRLKQFRNDSIHYNQDYDFVENSREAILTLLEIIDLQFNYVKRKDLFWVFDVPGEIWVKSEVVDDPFVIEFVLPHCLQLSPLDEPMASPPFKEKGARTKPLSDEEFIEIRRSRKHGKD